MKEKEIAEIRRRLHPERHSITHIYGCYVNGDEKEIIATFAQSLGLMPQEETEKYLGLFKRSLSGAICKNLIEVTFTTQQVADSAEHKLLMALRSTRLAEDAPRKEFYDKVIASQPLEGNYLILLLHNSYDVPFRHKDGAESDSNDIFSYIQCCICPVKLTKAALSYKASESEFHNSEPGWVVSPPELGFLFPAFDDRATNLYNALYYTHDTAENHDTFVETIFRTELPMPAAAQKSTFQATLGNALDADCTYEAVRSIHDQLCQMITLHKESKTPEPLTVTCQEVRDILESSSLPEERIAAFGEKLENEFGDADLSPKNLIDHRKLEVITPEVSIKVAPDRGDLIQTRVLGGVKYILIRADETVEVNGVPINITEKA